MNLFILSFLLVLQSIVVVYDRGYNVFSLLCFFLAFLHSMLQCIVVVYDRGCRLCACFVYRFESGRAPSLALVNVRNQHSTQV